jgi:tetrahydromethanopterin S-methyltransferase subunit B
MESYSEMSPSSIIPLNRLVFCSLSETYTSIKTLRQYVKNYTESLFPMTSFYTLNPFRGRTAYYSLCNLCSKNYTNIFG